MNFNARLANNLSRVSALCALLVAGLAAAVLTSWSLGRWQLGAFGADYVPMAPSTAVALLLLSGAVLLVGRWPGRAVVYYAYIVVAAVAALSVVILLQGPADFELSPEKWLSRTNELVGGIPVGRMSPVTALSFLLAALALLFRLPPFSPKRALEHAANLLAAGVALTGLVMVLGYATGTPLLYGGRTIPMAWTTTVAFTLLGLALLGARPDTVLRYFADEVMLLPSRGNAHRREWLLPRLFIVLAVAIGMTGFFYLRRQQALGRQTAMKGLSVIADLKAAQIADWCRERLADADEMLFNVPTLAPALQSFLADQGKRDARDRLDRWINAVRAHKAYERVVVLDRLGRVRLVDPPGDGEINPQLLSEIAVARRNRRVTLGDLQAHPSKPRLGLPVLVPMFLPVNTAGREDDGFVGAIVLEMNPSQYLFPAIQTWPTPSATAETLLVRLDGANVLFLNELRHRKNTALSLRRPLSDPRLPAAIGLRGEAAAVEGVDYRGEPVLAVMRRVPNTAWMIVAKVDQAEIYAPLRLEALSVGAVVALLLLALALGSMNVRRRELTKLMQRDLALEQERNAMAERLAYLTKYANDMMLFTDQDWRIVDANDRAVKAYGYSDEELQRLTLRDLQAPESRETFDQHARQLHVQNGMIVESVHQRKDGSTFPVESSMRAVEFEGQHFHQSIIRNITERKRAEEAQERLVAILEATTDFVATAAADGQVLYYNRAARQLLGIREDEDISNIRIPHTHPEWANRIVLDEGIPSAVRDGVWSGETVLLSRDGKEIPVSQVILAHKAPDGTVEFLSTIARDITERKQADATRQALYLASLQIQEPLGLQERLNRLLQTAQTVLALDRITVLLADKEGQELRAVASLGVDEPLDAIRIPIGAAGGALAEAYRTHQMIIWDGRLPLPERLRLQSPYDEIAALRSRVFAIVPLVVQGRAIGVLGVDRKHSPRALEPAMLELLQLFASQAALAIEHGRLYEEQRMAAIQLEATVEARTRELQAANAQLQEAMRQAQAASRHKSMFLANMSHELRTPLNAILGFSELLAQQAYGPLTEKQARYVDNVHTSGQHLLALINDLLDLSKVEAGKLELRPQSFDLREALEAALHVLRPQAEAKQQALRLQVADDLSAITADPLRVKQILYNLISNAVKFTPAGGSITVTAKRGSRGKGLGSSEASPQDPKPYTLYPGDYVEIAVVDTGIGIKPEDLPKLFQPFTQLEYTLTRQAQGTGLGLALTKHLVELHGGTIWAESAGEGRGSTFTICLPLPSHAS